MLLLTPAFKLYFNVISHHKEIQFAMFIFIPNLHRQKQVTLGLIRGDIPS